MKVFYSLYCLFIAAYSSNLFAQNCPAGTQGQPGNSTVSCRHDFSLGVVGGSPQVVDNGKTCTVASITCNYKPAPNVVYANCPSPGQGIGSSIDQSCMNPKPAKPLTKITFPKPSGSSPCSLSKWLQNAIDNYCVQNVGLVLTENGTGTCCFPNGVTPPSHDEKD